MQEAYLLRPPAAAAKKKPKRRDPRDCNQTVTAAKKKAKAREAVVAKELRADPKAQALDGDEQRTGLRNLGATCYMNSLLQTLYMNRAFRRGIFSWRVPAGGAGSGKGSPQGVANAVCGALQMLFAQLQHSERSCYDPAALTEALSLDTGVQQDAQARRHGATEIRS